MDSPDLSPRFAKGPCVDGPEDEDGGLPSYEAAVDIVDVTKLPSYKRISSARYHPYERPRLEKKVDERDRLLNTVFDDEYIPLNVPATRSRTLQGPFQMMDGVDAALRLERAIQSELRVQRLDAAILEFIDGVRRAGIPQ